MIILFGRLRAFLSNNINNINVNGNLNLINFTISPRRYVKQNILPRLASRLTLDYIYRRIKFTKSEF